MTTTIEAKIQQKAYDAVQLVGTTATFNEYPSLVPNTDQSTVTKGPVTPHAHKVTPPEPYLRQLAGGDVEANDLHAQRLRIFLPTGIGTTSTPIAFTPELGQEVVFGGKTWRVVEIHPVQTGDDITLYGLILEE